MLHCFITNPAAGSGREQASIVPQIMEMAKWWKIDYEIHRTLAVGEATLYVKDRLSKNAGQAVRFYSIGGDGTVREIINGMYGNPNAEVAIVPVGSGNDFVRNFGSEKPFLDISRQIAGSTTPVDVMYCDSNLAELTGYAINMFNFGFDAKVVSHMAKMREKSLLHGTGAYIAGVIRELSSYKMSHADIRIDDELTFRAEILLTGIGNGRFSGGGFDGIPMARVNDGYLDIMIISPITRLEFIRAVGSYHDGKHFEFPPLKDKRMHQRCRKVLISPVDELVFSADGESMTTKYPLRISIADEKVNFVLPEGVKMPEDEPKNV